MRNAHAYAHPFVTSGWLAGACDMLKSVHADTPAYAGGAAGHDHIQTFGMNSLDCSAVHVSSGVEYSNTMHAIIAFASICITDPEHSQWQEC
jgi:hypothetical protein